MIKTLRCCAVLLWLTLPQFITAQQPTDTTRRNENGQRRPNTVNLLFADTTQLNSSDYQLQLEKAFVILDEAKTKSELGFTSRLIKKELIQTDSVLAVLKENILNNSQALSLRNLQVFQTLLKNIHEDLDRHRSYLDSTESELNGLRLSLKPLIGDTVLRKLYRDSVLRSQFSTQVREMRRQFRSAGEQLRTNIAFINQLQTHNSSLAISTNQLLDKTDELLGNASMRVFGKESNYLWERDTIHPPQHAREAFARAYRAEQESVKYYFDSSGARRLLLLLIGLLFFGWIYRNIRAIKSRGALNDLKAFPFTYLPGGYIVSAFVVTLCIAPLFDLHAPSVYIEAMQFLLLIILTIICWSKWPRSLALSWTAMVILYICFSFTHHIQDPSTWQRWLLIGLNVLSIIFGTRFLSQMKEHLQLKRFLQFVIILHNILNVLSIISNITGRVTLAQILGNAAIFSFTQAIGLAVFSKIFIESILLQILASRIKRGNRNAFDYKEVLGSFRRLINILVIVLWAIVFTTNLNIYHALLQGFSGFLAAPRKIGDASFTMGGVLLFFVIIWVAHLLQRYISLFFGADNTDEDAHDKKQRSRLLIARLILLCLGYLLAVAASGVPVDKITIVLGALGVGIGLGLQNIVNNFVSGIILIFDRPLQIGDIVDVGDHSGKVREIGLRSSTILTADGAEVIIPNGDILSEKIVNWTLSNDYRRLEIDLNVSGSNDIEQVAGLVKSAVATSEFIIKEKEPQVLFTSIRDNEFALKVFCWSRDASQVDRTKGDLVLRLHSSLNKEGLKME